MSIIRPAFALGACALALTSIGCGKAADKIAEKATEKAAEQAVGGDVDIDTDGEGNVSISTPDGNFSTSSSQELPDDFPSDVPIVDGTMTTVSRTEADGNLLFMVTVTTDAGGQETLDALAADLAAEGWTETVKYGSMTNGSFGGQLGFEKGERNVVVTIGLDYEEPSETSVAYIVTERPPES